MPLSNDRKKNYRSIGHNLKPIVTIAGNGLSHSVLEELNRALEDHELIKVKFSVGDRDLKKELIEQVVKSTRSTLVQGIGNVALLLRPAKEPDPKKSNLLR